MKNVVFLSSALLAFVGPNSLYSDQKSSTETGSSKLNVVATNSIITGYYKEYRWR